MSIDLLSLPLVVLDIMFDYLPVWKIRQLACMCHDMNKLKNSAFSRRKHLRLFCGTVYSKISFSDKGKLYNINDDFDLNIRFDDEISSLDELPNFHVTLSPDWNVGNAQQIDQLVRWFPRICNLTLVVAHKLAHDCQARLFGLWPQLSRLKLINITKSELDWLQVGSQLNSLIKLEHLILKPSLHDVAIVKIPLTPLLESGRLKTFISDDLVSNDFDTMKKVKNRIVEPIDRSVWNRPELVATVENLETFGVSQYFTSAGPHFTNLRLLQKLKHIEIKMDKKHLRNWDFKYWTALQSLELKVKAHSYNLRTIFAHLVSLDNLENLYISYYGDELVIPPERACKRWPKLPTVLRFHLKTWMEPCKFQLLTHSFPNATEISFQLVLGTKMYQRLNAYCIQCSSTIERTLDKFDTNIEELLWFYNRNEAGRHELVPKVKLFTVEIGGKTRVSMGYHSIDE